MKIKEKIPSLLKRLGITKTEAVNLNKSTAKTVLFACVLDDYTISDDSSISRFSSSLISIGVCRNAL